VYHIDNYVMFDHIIISWYFSFASLKADQGVRNLQVDLGGEHCSLYSFICEISRTETWFIISELCQLDNFKQVNDAKHLISRMELTYRRSEKLLLVHVPTSYLKKTLFLGEGTTFQKEIFTSFLTFIYSLLSLLIYIHLLLFSLPVNLSNVNACCNFSVNFQ